MGVVLSRLQALKRELKVKELHVLDAARHRFLGHQQNLREAELKRLDQQVQKKVQLREKETQAVMEDVQTRTVELERQKALLEQELGHCQEKVWRRVTLASKSTPTRVLSVGRGIPECMFPFPHR